MPGSRGLQRTRSVRRRPWEQPPGLKDAIDKLRQLSELLSAATKGLSSDVVTLVELLQSQTETIETLALYQPKSALSSPCLRTPSSSTRLLSPQSPSFNHEYSKIDDITLHRQIEELMSSHVPRSKSSPGWIERTLSNPTVIEEVSPILTESLTSEPTPIEEPTIVNNTCTPEITISPRPLSRHLSQSKLLAPASPSAQNFYQHQSPISTIIEHAPPSPPQSPPPVPPKDEDLLLLTVPPLRPKSSSISMKTNNTTAICSSCDTQSWHPLNRPDPRESDLTCEAHVQEAASSLIANMKEKRRTPVGPLDGGTFNLYSSDYRKHYCVHDRADRQSLLVYSKSQTWDTDFPGVPAPQDGEVAMELTVYPDCLLIVKPFKVPKHAGWKWHTLEAIGDHAKPTTIEVMFLGNGFLKVRVRLSELLGDAFITEQEPERFIEFAGIWSASDATTEEHLLHYQVESEEDDAELVEGEEAGEESDETAESDGVRTPCAELPGDETFGSQGFFAGLNLKVEGLVRDQHLTVPTVSY